MHAQYYSNTPYKLGPNSVKWSVRPCEHTAYREAKVPRHSGYYLQDSMKKELSKCKFIFQHNREFQIEKILGKTTNFKKN